MTSPTKETAATKTDKNAKRTAARAAARLRHPHIAIAKVAEVQGQEPARVLYEAFGAFNEYFFGGKLAAGLVLITQTSNPRALGDYIERDVQGLESRIRISPHACGKGELFALDVLLHEMIHAWQVECDRNGENGYRGHGPRFAAMCNKIGAQLGLAPVGVKGRDGKPDCAHWPLNVRPAGYYGIDYVEPTRKPSAPKAPAAPAAPRDPMAERQAEIARRVAAFVSVLGEVDDQILSAVTHAIMGELDRRADSRAALAAE